MAESNALVKNDYYIENNYKLLLRQKKIHDEIVAAKKNKINTLSEKINCNGLVYYFFQKESKPKSFIHFNCLLSILRKIRNYHIQLKKFRKNKEEFISDPNEKLKGKTY